MIKYDFAWNDKTFKLGFPGNLCIAALTIFAMFQILVGILLQFQSTSSAIKKHSI